jgi:hypothetical protein
MKKDNLQMIKKSELLIFDIDRPIPQSRCSFGMMGITVFAVDILSVSFFGIGE